MSTTAEYNYDEHMAQLAKARAAIKVQLEQVLEQFRNDEIPTYQYAKRLWQMYKNGETRSNLAALYTGSWSEPK